MIRIFALLMGLLTWMSAAPANMLLTGAGGGGGGSSVSLVQHAIGTTAGSNSDSQTVSLTGVGSGNAVLVGNFTCNDISCAVTDTPTMSVAPTSGSCSVISGTSTFNQLRSTAIFLCTGGSGSQTYTSTWSCLSQCYYGVLTAVEITGQAASTPGEGGAVNSGNGTALTATTGTLSQSSGEFVYAMFGRGASSSPQTLLDGLGTYQITSGCSSCTVTNTATGASTGDWSESIVAIKHQ